MHSEEKLNSDSILFNFGRIFGFILFVTYFLGLSRNKLQIKLFLVDHLSVVKFKLQVINYISLILFIHIFLYPF